MKVVRSNESESCRWKSSLSQEAGLVTSYEERISSLNIPLLPEQCISFPFTVLQTLPSTIPPLMRKIQSVERASLFQTIFIASQVAFFVYRRFVIQNSLFLTFVRSFVRSFILSFIHSCLEVPSSRRSPDLREEQLTLLSTSWLDLVVVWYQLLCNQCFLVSPSLSDCHVLHSSEYSLKRSSIITLNCMTSLLWFKHHRRRHSYRTYLNVSYNGWTENYLTNLKLNRIGCQQIQPRNCNPTVYLTIETRDPRLINPWNSTTGCKIQSQLQEVISCRLQLQEDLRRHRLSCLKDQTE